VAPSEAFAGWIDSDPDWERLGPVQAGTVRFRLRPRGWPGDDPRLGPLNARLREAVNATGEVAVLRSAVAARDGLRLATGSGETGLRQAERAWAILRAEALRLGVGPPVVA
jgi:hypothetical protein